MASTHIGRPAPIGPVLFAFDGSELATFAIEEAARQLVPGRAAVVLCVWQPVDVGFVPTSKQHFDADQAPEVRRAAETTAAYGASLADKAGFRAQSVAVEAAPTWKGIVETVVAHQASLIVVGSHRRSGLVGHLVGSVAAAVVAHSMRRCSSCTRHNPERAPPSQDLSDVPKGRTCSTRIFVSRESIRRNRVDFGQQLSPPPCVLPLPPPGWPSARYDPRSRQCHGTTCRPWVPALAYLLVGVWLTCVVAAPRPRVQQPRGLYVRCPDDPSGRRPVWSGGRAPGEPNSPRMS